MKIAIFKTVLPNDLFFQLLKEICLMEKLQQNTYFIFNLESFQKAKYHELLIPFLTMLKDYYHTSKQRFIDISIPITYNKFTTILRQICKTNSIPFFTQICYNKSNYTVIYKIQYLI